MAGDDSHRPCGKADPAVASTLAIVGRYIIEPGVFTELSKMDRGTGHEIQITDSLSRRIGARLSQFQFHRHAV